MGELIAPAVAGDAGETVFKRAIWPAAVGAFFGVGFPVALLAQLWAPLGYLFWVVAPVVFVVLARVLARGDMTPARCPGCRRRWRNGQTRCHKCAAVVT